MRVIRKYANRRLYDTEQSRYVTLEDLRSLVLAEEVFKVEDAKSGEDLTRTILLTIIIEQEQGDGDAQIFSNELLEQFIRIYAMAKPLPLAGYLEQGTRLMMEQQQRMQEQWSQAIRHSPMEMMREVAEENLRFWQQAMGTGMAGSKGPAQPEADAPRDDETPNEDDRT
ncbi:MULTISPECIES: polyhydroxyalkanoate synthesis repressor PhaR [Cobetia]|uniref:Polyhydroxyalkanoate synthesis repressor PhaR n=1 Tax=Cobetia crustatorum TaxID=553385 RepID=A0A558HUR2_9GAMM|nr:MULTISPECIES: polyhydroxyalkanoate synthesis repressor PhaR [Cobetia]TVU72828.1 polyhydroxyalkanoate synthesis repressor PhaR [Cobetia crustatorum]